MRLRQSGLSLVEVMVAVAIGMIGILIIMQAYITGDRFNRSTLGEGGAQTNGLIALYTLERDVRMAGYGLSTSGVLGCGDIYWYYDPAYSSNVGGGTLPNITLAPIVIEVNATASVPNKITAMYSTASERMIPGKINGFNAKSSEVSVDGTKGFHEGDLILLVNSTGCTLGKVTHVQGVAQKIQLNPGIDGKQNPPAWGSFPTNYNSGDAILNLGDPVLRTYQIGNGKLQVIDALLSTGTATPVDLVDEIVDLRALYGKDTNDDGVVETWDNIKPATSLDWLRVHTVQIGILARIGNYERPSVPGGDCDATTVAPTWSGGSFPAVNIATVTSQDRCYRYRVFETTVPLRNIIWRMPS